MGGFRLKLIKAAMVVVFFVVCWGILQLIAVIPLKWIAANYSLWHLAAASFGLIGLAVLADRWMDRQDQRRRQQREDLERWPLAHRYPADDRRPPDQG